MVVVPGRDSGREAREVDCDWSGPGRRHAAVDVGNARGPDETGEAHRDVQRVRYVVVADESGPGADRRVRRVLAGAVEAAGVPPHSAKALAGQRERNDEGHTESCPRHLHFHSLGGTGRLYPESRRVKRRVDGAGPVYQDRAVLWPPCAATHPALRDDGEGRRGSDSRHRCDSQAGNGAASARRRRHAPLPGSGAVRISAPRRDPGRGVSHALAWRPQRLSAAPGARGSGAQARAPQPRPCTHRTWR